MPPIPATAVNPTKSQTSGAGNPLRIFLSYFNYEFTTILPMEIFSIMTWASHGPG
jgi:hypothetical protein